MTNNNIPELFIRQLFFDRHKIAREWKMEHNSLLEKNLEKTF